MYTALYAMGLFYYTHSGDIAYPTLSKEPQHFMYLFMMYAS